MFFCFSTYTGLIPAGSNILATIIIITATTTTTTTTTNEDITAHQERLKKAKIELVAAMSPQQPLSTSRGLSHKETYPQNVSNPSQTHTTLKNSTKISKSRSRAKKHHLKLLGPVQEHSTTTPSKTISPLLRLPEEIRARIYSYALTSPTSELIYNASKMRFQLNGIGYGLQSSCHAIALETQYLHLKLNRLVFPHDARISVCERDFAAISTNLGRLACAKGWKMHVERRVPVVGANLAT